MPDTLFSFFPKDFLLFVDESHVTIPQVRAMYAGDRSRKETLVEHGFRLPCALDNRPLKFEEWEQRINQVVFVSATPSDYELQQTGGEIVEQIIRPTGLLDPRHRSRAGTWSSAAFARRDSPAGGRRRTCACDGADKTAGRRSLGLPL